MSNATATTTKAPKAAKSSINAPVAAPKVPRNDTRLKEFNAKLTKLGETSASGQLTKPYMALELAIAVHEGILDETGVKAAYMVYLSGRAKGFANTKQVGLAAGETDADKDENSIKVNVSKNLQIAKAAGLPILRKGPTSFHDVLANVTRIRDAMLGAGEKVKPAFDCYVEVAREQIKLKDAVLDDEEAIKEECRKVETATKDALGKLMDDYKRMWTRAEKDLPDNPFLPGIVAAIADAIVHEGGKIPAMTDDEKKAEKARETLAALGFKI